MECSCGSNEFTKLKEKHIAYTIKYSECKSCGRIGGEKLYRDKQMTENGLKARQQYLVLCAINET